MYLFGCVNNLKIGRECAHYISGSCRTHFAKQLVQFFAGLGITFAATDCISPCGLNGFKERFTALFDQQVGGKGVFEP